MKKTLTAVLAIAALGLAAACGSPAPDDEALVEGERTTQAGPCITRVIYGNTWLNAAGHDRSYFDVRGRVTWDGHCKVNAAGNAYAVLSNGWRPHFKGRTCVIALQQRGACSPVPGRCATRIAYGPAWLPAPSHPARHDDVKWVVTWDGVCHNDGDRSWARLSNGWKPVFRGRNACDLSFRYTQCGGLFANPVIDRDCPDPAVLKDGKTYYMVCTHAPIRSSTDLVHWKWRGKVFTEKNLPAWNKGPFLAPEMHRIGSKYVVYYSSGKGPTGRSAPPGPTSRSGPTGTSADPCWPRRLRACSTPPTSAPPTAGTT